MDAEVVGHPRTTMAEVVGRVLDDAQAERLDLVAPLSIFGPLGVGDMATSSVDLHDETVLSEQEVDTGDVATGVGSLHDLTAW